MLPGECAQLDFFARHLLGLLSAAFRSPSLSRLAHSYRCLSIRRSLIPLNGHGLRSDVCEHLLDDFIVEFNFESQQPLFLKIQYQSLTQRTCWLSSLKPLLSIHQVQQVMLVDGLTVVREE